MITLFKSRNVTAGCRSATVVLALTVACAVVAHAQTQNPPYSLFQYAAIAGSGNTISIARVPVIIDASTTVYKDISLQFDVDASGNLTLTSGFPLVVDSLAPLVSSFLTGQYTGPSNIYNGQNLITINGPGGLGGGVTAYVITLSKGAGQYTYPAGGTWYVGPIDNSPLAARLKKAGITSTAWSYGVGTATGGPTCAWGINTIIGVQQIGNTLTGWPPISE